MRKGRLLKVMITFGQQHKRRMARALPEGLPGSRMVLATIRLGPCVNVFTAWTSAEKGAGNEVHTKKDAYLFQNTHPVGFVNIQPGLPVVQLGADTLEAELGNPVRAAVL